MNTQMALLDSTFPKRRIFDTIDQVDFAWVEQNSIRDLENLLTLTPPRRSVLTSVLPHEKFHFILL